MPKAPCNSHDESPKFIPNMLNQHQVLEEVKKGVKPNPMELNRDAR